MGRISGFRPSVFKGRKARLNRTIFQVLAHEDKLAIYDICKRVRRRSGFRYTRYSVINRRIRALKQKGYVQTVGTKEALKAPVRSLMYQLTARAYLAILLDRKDLNDFIQKADEAAILTTLGVLVT